MILQILKQVAQKRLDVPKQYRKHLCSTITLSLPFMEQAVKELRELTDYTIITTEMATEFFIMEGDVKFTVRHRGYKDDSNDYDVELFLLEQLNRQKDGKETDDQDINGNPV